MWADVVIFDPQTITDRATFENPNQLSARHAVCVGQRRTGDRRPQADECAARESAERAGISALIFSEVPSEARDPYRLRKSISGRGLSLDDCGCLDSFVRGEILASMGSLA